MSFLWVTACSVSPPPSRVPDAKTAVELLDSTYNGVSGLSGQGVIDFLSDKGRVRGDVALMVSSPANLRFALTASLIGNAGELASDGVEFQAEDKTQNKNLIGEAKPCNIARLTQVALPSKVLVPMLWGMRPAIDGPIVCDSIDWSGEGYYKVMLRGQGKEHQHELHIAPTEDDWNKPYKEQHMRLLGVRAWSHDSTPKLVYEVKMADHQWIETSKPKIDPDGISPDVPPSGPSVRVMVPKKVKIEVAGRKGDVIFLYKNAVLNPPIDKNSFRLRFQEGTPLHRVECEDGK